MRCSVPSNGPPACWARFRNDSDCQSCAWQSDCKTASVLESSPTVAEIIHHLRAPSGSSDLSTEDLLDFAKDRLLLLGGRLRRGALHDRRYLNAMSSVLAASRVSNIDPRAYIQAQVDTAGREMAMRGLPVAPGCFAGPKADGRYQRWLARSKRASSSSSAADAESRTRGLAAAVFVRDYIETGDLKRSVAAAKSVHLGWSLDMMTPLEHMEALSYALALRDPSLPDRVCPPDVWTWSQLREFILRVIDCPPEVVVEEAPSADDDSTDTSDLGELV